MESRGMSYDEIGRLTLPQLMCRFNDKPPESGEKITSYAALREAEMRRESEWNASP